MTEPQARSGPKLSQDDRSRSGRRARQLLAAVAVVGMLAAGASLVLPLTASFAGDPLLRLVPFDGGPPPDAADVACGSPLSLRLDPDGGLSLYARARDGACSHAASRRVAAAGAAAATVVASGLLVLAVSSSRLRAVP